MFAAAAVPLSMLAFQVDPPPLLTPLMVVMVPLAGELPVTQPAGVDPLTAAVRTAPSVVVAVAGATDTEQTFSVPEPSSTTTASLLVVPLTNDVLATNRGSPGVVGTGGVPAKPPPASARSASIEA